MACLIKRVLQFSNAVAFGPIVFKDSEGNVITNDCQFSWSSDSVCWTSWVNYKQYLKLAKNIESDFYLRILFTSTLGDVSINNMLTKCYSVCLYNSNPFVEDLCTSSVFNPYANLECALQLQNQLANSIICMFGIPIYYFRVLPDKETADYTFKEYVMHNVESVKQLKLMIPDGEMPSSKPQFSDLDFDWEVDWEVELGKQQFANAFGDDAFPKQRDFIYIPMMKRMWEVNSAYDEKNGSLMWHSTTWKLGLIKWNEKTNVEQGDFDELIDNLVVNTYDNVFAELESNEQCRESATEQAEKPTYTADNINNIFLSDYIRKQFTKSTITISEKQYNHGSIVVAKNIYQFAEPSENKDTLITYQKGYCGENGVLSFIISTDGKVLNGKKTLISFGNINIQSDGAKVYFDDAVADLQKSASGVTYTDYIVICKWSRKDFVKEIVAYPYVSPNDIAEYLRRPEMYKFNFDVTEENGVKEYNNDFIAKNQKEVKVTGAPFAMTNIKLYNSYMSNEQAIKESLKYTTKSTKCVFNDVARPVDAGQGYSVK